MINTYAVDFDGTLCENAYPDIGAERTEVVNKVKQLIENGDEVILWTCRVGDALTAAVNWCAERGITLAAVNENTKRNIDAFGNDTRKVFANYYIDDRAVNIEAFTQREDKKAMNTRKSFFISNFKTRAEPDGKKYIDGYFVVFNTKTELWEGVFEEVDPNALDASLLDNDIRCLYNHNDDIVLGRTTVKTFTLRKDDRGVFGSVEVNENDKTALDVYARVSRGDVSGCSYGYFPTREECVQQEDGTVLYRVLEADVIEMSVCPFPAYPQTEIQARKADFEGGAAKRRETLKIEIKKRLEKLKC
jgi:HK97 family phage prohead protease